MKGKDYRSGRRGRLAFARLPAAFMIIILLMNILFPVYAEKFEGAESAGIVLPSYGLYEIISALDEDYCLDIVFGSTSNGANLQLYKKNGTNSQKFFLVPVEGEEDIYTIVNANSAKAVDVYGNSTRNGANAQQYTKNDTTAQLFRLIPNADGDSFRIQGVGSEKYLTVEGGQAENNANVCIYEDLTPALNPASDPALIQPES